MAGNSTDFMINVQSNLEKTLKASNKEASVFVDKLEQFNRKFDDANKKGGVLNRTLAAVGKTAGAMLGALAAGSAILGINSLVEGVFELDKNSRQTAKTMGALGYNFQQTKDSVYALSIATGEATEKTMEIYQNLANLRVSSKDVNRLTSDVINFSRATTMGEEATSQLAGSLVTVGKLSAKQSEDVMNSMVQAQRAFGLTRGQMEGMSDSIIRSTQQLQQLGRNAGQVTQFTAGVAKLSSAFASVGVSAETANKFVSDLLDPDKVTDNALLYSKLGISIQDAFTGNVKMEDSIDKFKALGEQMKQMNPAAAAAYARSLGMSVGDLRAMADIDMSKYNKALQQGADSATAMKIASQQNLSPQEKISQMWNRIGATVASLVDKFMPFVEMIVNVLEPIVKDLTTWFNNNINNGVVKNFVNGTIEFIKKIPQIVSGIVNFFSPAGLALIAGGIVLLMMKSKKAFSKNIEEGVSEGIKAGFAKNEIVKNVASGAGTEVGKAMATGFGAEVGNLQSEYLSQISQMNGSKLTKGMASSASIYEGRNSMYRGGGIVGSLSARGEAMAESGGNRRAQIAQDAEIRYQIEKNRLDTLSEYQKKLESEMKTIKDANGMNSEFLKRQDESKTIKASIDKITNETEQLERIKTQKDKNYYNGLSALQRNNVINQMKEEDKLSMERFKAIEKQKTDENKLKTITESEITRLSGLKRSYEEELQLIKLQNIKNESEETIKSLNEKLVKEQDVQMELGKKLNKARGERSDAVISAEALSPKTFAKAVRDGFDASVKNVASKFESLGSKISTSVDQFKKSIVPNLKKVGANLAKTGAKMALMSLPLLILAPLLQKLQPVIDVISGLFANLVDKLLPPMLTMLAAVVRLLSPLIKLLLPPLIQILGNVIGALGEVVKAIGNFTNNKDLQSVGESMIQTGNSMNDVSKLIGPIVDDVSKSLDELAAKENNKSSIPAVVTSSAASGSNDQNKPVVLQATGTGIRQASMIDAQTKYQETAAKNSTAQLALAKTQSENSSKTVNKLSDLIDLQKNIEKAKVAALNLKNLIGKEVDDKELSRSGLIIKDGKVISNGIEIGKATKTYSARGMSDSSKYTIEQSFGY